MYVIRGAYCMGWLYPTGGKKTAIWRSESGSVMGGTRDHDLAEYIGPFEEQSAVQ